MSVSNQASSIVGRPVTLLLLCGLGRRDRGRYMAGIAQADSNQWFDEISFDPEAPLLQMGTRRLGESGWLIRDEDRAADLGLKDRLMAERHDEVFAVEADQAEGALAAAERLLEMVQAEVQDQGTGWGLAPGVSCDSECEAAHPLEQAALLVQEDLCLIHRRDGTWHLDAASLCFPSRWLLADKIGQPLLGVHAKVDGYDAALADRVNRAFDHLLSRPDDRPVWRRNWFVHPIPDRFQPQRPVDGDPLVESDRVLDNLWVRSERQILRRVLDPDWAVFSIRIQQASMAQLFVIDGRSERIASYFSEASAADAVHHGVSEAQCEHLLNALGRKAPN